MIPHFGHRLLPPRRARAFRDNKGRCLNCHGTDYSFTRWPQSFINGNGCLNPHLGQPGENGDAYRRWQQRMRSYQRRDTRSSLSDRRRDSSRRNDNSLHRNNHGGNPHEPPQNTSRNNGRSNYNYGSSSNAGAHAPLLLGQGAQNTRNMLQSLTLYQPNNGTPPAPSSAAGTPRIRYGAAHNANSNPNARRPGTLRTGGG